MSKGKEPTGTKHLILSQRYINPNTKKVVTLMDVRGEECITSDKTITVAVFQRDFVLETHKGA